MKTFNMIAVLLLGSAYLVGCGAKQDESAVQTDEATPAAETPAPAQDDAMAPADTTDAIPADEPAPAMSDTLPTAEEPPPLEPAPPPG